MPAETRFIADVMLGKLATWLRLLGCDADVRERVPPSVFETQRAFKTCGRCGRIYWSGTHTDKALAEVRKIFGLPE